MQTLLIHRKVISTILGPTLHLSLDIEIASFDSMSEVNMVG